MSPPPPHTHTPRRAQASVGRTAVRGGSAPSERHREGAEPPGRDGGALREAAEGIGAVLSRYFFTEIGRFSLRGRPRASAFPPSPPAAAARARTAHALPASRAAPPARMREALSARHCARAMPGETLCACAEGAARAPCAPSVCACAPAEGRPRYRPRVPRRSVTVRGNGEACRGTAGSFGVARAFRAGGAAGSPVREGPREAPDPLRSYWSLPPSSARHFLPLATGRSAAPRLAQPAVRAPHAIGRPSACGRGLS